MSAKIFMQTVLQLIVVTFSFSCYAWNDVGHMIIADIAYERVDPIVRTKIDSLLETFVKDYPDFKSFQQMAIWPDALKAHRVDIYSHWHYANIPFTNDGTPVKSIKDIHNAIWVVNKLEVMVGSPYVNSVERARSLAFLIHIVGDLHHPLHTIEYFSAAHPNGDEGGTLYSIRNPADHTRTINLHKLWDDGLGLFKKEITAENIAGLAKTITSVYPENYFGEQAHNLFLADWTNESLTLAKTNIYTLPENHLPPTAYMQQGEQIVQQRLALAGYRLAALLNTLLIEDQAELKKTSVAASVIK